MKKHKNLIVKLSVFLVTCVLSIGLLAINIHNSKADTLQSRDPLSVYANKTLVIPVNSVAATSLLFYANPSYSGYVPVSPYAAMWLVRQSLDGQYQIQSYPNMVLQKTSSTDYTQNGFSYVGGNSWRFLYAPNFPVGSPTSTSFSQPTNPPYYQFIILQFNNTSSMTNINMFSAISLAWLLNNGAFEQPNNYDPNNNNFWFWFGQYYSDVDYQQGYNTALADVKKKPHDFGYVSNDEKDVLVSEAYDNGYDDAYAQIGGVGLEYENVLTRAFHGFSEILNIQVFPNITIGLILGLPLLLGLFLIVIKLIRG